MARFLIGHWSSKDLLQWESVIYHSIKLEFEGQVAKKFLNGISYLLWIDKSKSCEKMICFYFHILLSDNLDRVPFYQDDKTVKWFTTKRINEKSKS